MPYYSSRFSGLVLTVVILFSCGHSNIGIDGFGPLAGTLTEEMPICRPLYIRITGSGEPWGEHRSMVLEDQALETPSLRTGGLR